MVANNAEILANEYEYGREVRVSGSGKNRTKTEMVYKEPVQKRPREPVVERSGSQFSPTELLINALEYLFLIFGLLGGVLSGLFSARSQATQPWRSYSQTGEQLDRQRPPSSRPHQG